MVSLDVSHGPSHRQSFSDIQDLVLSLGNPWLGQDDNNILPSATDTIIAHHTVSAAFECAPLILMCLLQGRAAA